MRPIYRCQPLLCHLYNTRYLLQSFHISIESTWLLSQLCVEKYAEATVCFVLKRIRNIDTAAFGQRKNGARAKKH